MLFEATLLRFFPRRRDSPAGVFGEISWRRIEEKRIFRKYMRVKMLIREEASFIMHISSNDDGFRFREAFSLLFWIINFHCTVFILVLRFSTKPFER